MPQYHDHSSTSSVHFSLVLCLYKDENNGKFLYNVMYRVLQCLKPLHENKYLYNKALLIINFSYMHKNRHVHIYVILAGLPGVASGIKKQILKKNM